MVLSCTIRDVWCMGIDLHEQSNSQVSWVAFKALVLIRLTTGRTPVVKVCECESVVCDRTDQHHILYNSLTTHQSSWRNSQSIRFTINRLLLASQVEDSGYTLLRIFHCYYLALRSCDTHTSYFTDVYQTVNIVESPPEGCGFETSHSRSTAPLDRTLSASTPSQIMMYITV